MVLRFLKLEVNIIIMMHFGRTYTNVEITGKIFRSLLKNWEAKVMAIREANNLTKLPLEELIGSLMTHKITMEKQE
ncbi:hypothetical protein NC651_016578 [Populus alba x Populus x berolinensis]|nr:hypothetical protein NC651_016578 [Populus alba x Populus x berolinensis]